MERAIFNSKEFAVLSLALNAFIPRVPNGLPGITQEDMRLLMRKCSNLVSQGKEYFLETQEIEEFTLIGPGEPHDGTPETWVSSL